MDIRTITVKSTSKVSAKPDLIVITIDLETTKPNYIEALKVATADIDSLRAALVGAGHDGKALKTTKSA
ncbi:MAG: SIMPL domain-containing protein [Oscillospiraceae bacterium]|jgi:uncharacterized protein YggE|nr:SIMPL domain-containing protein [Oscillospiraceae bacterium]